MKLENNGYCNCLEFIADQIDGSLWMCVLVGTTAHMHSKFYAIHSTFNGIQDVRSRGNLQRFIMLKMTIVLQNEKLRKIPRMLCSTQYCK